MPDYGFGVSVSQTGMNTAQLSLQIVANNLANASTPGFESALPTPSAGEAVARPPELFKGSGKDAPLLEEISTGQTTSTPSVDLQQGTLSLTGVSSNLALTVPGYLPVRTPSGIQYTRNGDFQTSATGQIVTASGDPLLGLNMQPIAVKGTFTVQNGTVVNAEGKPVAKLAVAQFANPSGLKATGENLLASTSASGTAQYTPALGSDVKSGYLENSNTNTVDAFNQLITAQTQFSLSAKTLQQAGSLATLTAQMAQNL